MLTWVLPGNFYYCSCTWDVQSMRGIFHVGIYFICWFRVLFCAFWNWIEWYLGSSPSSPNAPRVPSGVLVAVEVGGRGDKWSGNTTAVDIQTLLKDFLNTSQRLSSFIDGSLFLIKRKTYSLWTTTPHFRIIRWQIKGTVPYVVLQGSFEFDSSLNSFVIIQIIPFNFHTQFCY